VTDRAGAGTTATGCTTGAGRTGAVRRTWRRCTGRCARTRWTGDDGDAWRAVFVAGFVGDAAIGWETALLGWLDAPLVIARTGALTAATTSPVAALSAGANPGEDAGAAPPGSMTRARKIAAIASAAGKALVIGAFGFILGVPSTAATTRRSSTMNGSAAHKSFPAARRSCVFPILRLQRP
jgi:hypothetical protein